MESGVQEKAPAWEIEVKFKEEEWRYFRILRQMPEDTKRVISYMTEQLNETRQKVRRVLIELIEKGYILDRSYQFTAEGERSYQEHMVWWRALVWRLRAWNLPQDKIWMMADHLLCSSSPEFIGGAMEQYEYASMQEIPEAESERFDGTSFPGRLPYGTYHVGFCLIDGEENTENSPFAAISEINRHFGRQAKLVIEPTKSCLCLTWTEAKRRLEGITCSAAGRSQRRKAEDGRVEIPVSDMTFEHVQAYKMLEGELPLVIHVSDGEGTEKEKSYPVFLELSLMY